MVEDTGAKRITISRILLSVSNESSLLRLDALNAQSGHDEQVISYNSNHNKATLGQTIKGVFTDKNVQISNNVQFDICSDLPFFNKTKLDKYLLKVANTTECNLDAWGAGVLFPINRKEFQARFFNADPHSFIGAIAAAVKDNSAALGSKAVLLDIKAIEQVPEIAKNISQYLQRKI